MPTYTDLTLEAAATDDRTSLASLATKHTGSNPTMSSFTDASSPTDSRRLTNRNTNRYSVNQLYSMAAENDTDIEDDLSRGQY